MLPAEPAAESLAAKRPRLEPSEALPSASSDSTAADIAPIVPNRQAVKAGSTGYGALGDSGPLDLAVDAGDWDEGRGGGLGLPPLQCQG